MESNHHPRQDDISALPSPPLASPSLSARLHPREDEKTQGCRNTSAARMAWRPVATAPSRQPGGQYQIMSERVRGDGMGSVLRRLASSSDKQQLVMVGPLAIERGSPWLGGLFWRSGHRYRTNGVEWPIVPVSKVFARYHEVERQGLAQNQNEALAVFDGSELKVPNFLAQIVGEGRGNDNSQGWLYFESCPRLVVAEAWSII